MKNILSISLIALFLTHFTYSYSQTQKTCKVLKKEIADSYEGGCKKGLANGAGVAKGIEIYEGKFKKGLPHGFGTYTYTNGDIYTGEWNKGLRHGMGKFKSADKTINKEGLWKDNKFYKKKEFPKFNILMRQNVQSVSITNQGTSIDKIEIHYMRDGKEAVDIMNKTIVGNSGIQDNVSKYTVFTDMNYPFECNITFRAKGRFSTTTQTSRSTYESTNVAEQDFKVEFRINEPGHWVIWIKY